MSKWSRLLPIWLCGKNTERGVRGLLVDEMVLRVSEHAPVTNELPGSVWSSSPRSMRPFCSLAASGRLMSGKGRRGIPIMPLTPSAGGISANKTLRGSLEDSKPCQWLPLPKYSEDAVEFRLSKLPLNCLSQMLGYHALAMQ